MDSLNKTMKPHCLVIPFPLQGHINPMLQFSKRLKHKGNIKITLSIVKSFFKTIQDFPTDSFAIETISDGFDDGGASKVEPQVYESRSREAGSETLIQLLEKLRDSGSAVTCVIYDPFYTWVLDVAKNFGLVTAMFFTQSNSVNNIYFHAYKGELKLPLSDSEIVVPGGLPVLERGDFPSFIVDCESDPVRCDFMVKQFKNWEMVDWIFVNTFYELEPEVCDWMTKFMPVKAIGPTIPSMYLDKRLLDDKQYGISVFKPMTELCMNWLNKQSTQSVIYVSFGSFAKPTIEQVEELALALKMSNMHFLWVVRELEESKLPKNYREEIDEKGLILTWCPQLEVLEHEAIGCFITHCGWNSTLEALSSGVPMVGVPQWSDQSTNVKFIEDVWKIGVKARKDEKGIVSRNEMIQCIKYVMEGEIGEGIRERAIKLMEMAKEAVDEGGSSDRNIEEFVSTLVKV